MSSCCSRTLVERFFTCFSATDVEGVTGLLHPEASWSAMGLSSDPPIADRRDRQGIVDLMKAVRAQMPDGLELTPTGWTIEGPRVAVEMVSNGTKTTGKIYRNHYHFLIEIEDGLIRTLREYMDTLHVKQVLIDDS